MIHYRHLMHIVMIKRLHLSAIFLKESINMKTMTPYIAMLFNNGQSANCLCLLITYFLWRGVEGAGGPKIKSILPKYIEKKSGKASWSNTWIPITVLHRLRRTNKWEYIPCPHLSWHTGNGYLLLEYILYVWNDDLISQHIWILFERQTWVLTHIRILECERVKEKNWRSESLIHSCIIILSEGAWVLRDEWMCHGYDSFEPL